MEKVAKTVAQALFSLSYISVLKRIYELSPASKRGSISDEISEETKNMLNTYFNTSIDDNMSLLEFFGNVFKYISGYPDSKEMYIQYEFYKIQLDIESKFKHEKIIKLIELLSKIVLMSQNNNGYFFDEAMLPEIEQFCNPTFVIIPKTKLLNGLTKLKSMEAYNQ